MTDRSKSDIRDHTCFWKIVVVRLAFRDKKESPEDDNVNQPRSEDREGTSDLSHSRWSPSDAYLRGEYKLQLGTIGAYHLSIVQYLPKGSQLQ